jgi:hypothetical protein
MDDCDATKMLREPEAGTQTLSIKITDNNRLFRIPLSTFTTHAMYEKATTYNSTGAYLQQTISLGLLRP